MATGLNLHNMRDRVAKHYGKTTRAPEKTKVAPFIDHKHPSVGLRQAAGTGPLHLAAHAEFLRQLAQ